MQLLILFYKFVRVIWYGELGFAHEVLKVTTDDRGWK